MSLQRARSVAEYVEWVKQAVFEVNDLRDCLEYDLEDLTAFPAFLEPLDAGIKTLYSTMCDGSYCFGRADLPFMDIVHQHAGEIPFYTLLQQINDTHRQGLDVRGNAA